MPSTAKKRRVINPAWKKWDKTMRRTKVTLANVRDEPSPHNDKWKRKMIAHWNKNLDQLRNQEPPKYIK